MYCKWFFVAVVVSLSFSHLSFAASGFKGHFSLAHEVAFMNYPDRISCEKIKATWRNGICIAQGEDTVDVKDVGNKLSLKVSTVVTNAHVCDFSAPAQAVAANQIMASIPAQEYDPKSNGTIDVTCEVTVTYINMNTVSVNNNGHCSFFCGLNATLEIEGAKRK